MHSLLVVIVFLCSFISSRKTPNKVDFLILSKVTKFVHGLYSARISTRQALRCHARHDRAGLEVLWVIAWLNWPDFVSMFLTEWGWPIEDDTLWMHTHNSHRFLESRTKDRHFHIQSSNCSNLKNLKKSLLWMSSSTTKCLQVGQWSSFPWSWSVVHLWLSFDQRSRQWREINSK